MDKPGFYRDGLLVVDENEEITFDTDSFLPMIWHYSQSDVPDGTHI